MMYEVSAVEVSRLVLNRGRPVRSPGEEALVLAVLRELAKGAPVGRERRMALGSELGLDGNEVSEALASIESLAQLGPKGELRGVLGLSLDPAPHEFIIRGRTFYTWCAVDTTFLPVLLGVTAKVRSTCPVSRTPIRLRIGPGRVEQADPDTAVLSVVVPQAGWVGGSVDSLRAAFCDFSLWFRSESDARTWAPAAREYAVVHWIEAGELGRNWAGVVRQRR